VAYPDGTDEAGTPTVLEKSYSPVSHPALEGVVDLLVKAYVPRPGGGVGSFICNLEIGETMQATLKKKRMVHGSAEVTRRWRAIGLVGGGTGIAPLIQIARIVLDDPHDLTTVRMLSINRHEEDILMKAELDAMAAAQMQAAQGNAGVSASAACVRACTERAPREPLCGQGATPLPARIQNPLQ
jgi:NAD(P)H-flavin reductase